MQKTISVYFSGTGFSINDQSFLSADLLKNTQENESQIKMGFNGCGVDYGFTGIIFGSGLDKQCAQVIARILKEINAGHQVTLNAYGHSRGAVAALLLAKQLSNVDQEKLTINLALLDPVPGNLITTATLDPLQISLANKAMDLSDCKPLRKVLALYPQIPLPAIACHAPLLATYPQETDLDVEVVNGCHAQAEQLFDRSSDLVKLRVEEFLVQNGTVLQTERDYNDTAAMKELYLKQYQAELRYVKPNSRDTHAATGTVITAKADAKFLNNRHKKLAGDNTQAPVALSIEPRGGFFSGLYRALQKHPVATQTAKWTLISLSVASLLFATGGLAALPFLAPIVAQVGALSILAAAPVVGGVLSALWYGAAKPLLTWCAGKLFYPYYANHTVATATPVAPGGTTGQLLQSLGAGQVQSKSPSNDAVPHHATSPLHTKKDAVSVPEVDNSSSLCLN